MSRVMESLLWLYQRLLMLYPPSHRELFGEEMEGVFRQALDESVLGGVRPLAMLLMREIKDLPAGLWGAYRRQRKLVLALQDAGGHDASRQLHARSGRAGLLLWGCIVALAAMALFVTVWLVIYNGYQDVPQLSGSSAIILEDHGHFVRLPQHSYQCVAEERENKAVCTAMINNEPLHLLLIINGLANSSYTGSCTGSYAGAPVSCMQLFTRAKDREMPPVLVQRPVAMVEAQWQRLLDSYAFTFPSAHVWLHWWLTVAVVMSVAVALFMWFLIGPSGAQRQGQVRPLRLAGSLVAGIASFFPLAWLSLLLSFGLESWIERF